MIELTPLARPYAKAMFAAAIEDSSLESTSKELETIALAANSPEVAGAIENPSLSRKQVVDLLLDLFDSEISDKSKKLLAILAENKRLNLFKTIFVIYTELVQEHNNQSSVEVFVASKPSQEPNPQLKKSFK
jgi:F-type H+-transporting ATPase subunit delta